ncbi:MAG: branched-chain amino acid ABC transporter permease [Gammaproteobacteria bacterium]|nr:branched-chain amino acid ABC transporter permease [Gemmatimonadota bacterium]NIR98510.1 branched-chain amino acid ABC transporter permease [Gammaproteobacteria bacterium]NIT64688.1 branched-chain amino acid ABC transporter permease [Gammaproteobacteria bacterium]NIV21646.1 branched-chain amino acid ABC transporter permease [Gammaproteobacteria bacterium]NIW76335.1 branched-chain amino acid ABC transporter permease [Gemmatimonadota bacterium]
MRAAPARNRGSSLARPLAIGAPFALILALVPQVADPYQTQLLTYGLVFAIAALGFNLLLGYSGLLSFGHSAYFGMGAYTVGFIVRDLGVASMELAIVGGVLGTVLISALFGYVCVRHTRIFFAILTLALSQVLWSLAFKFFWITGGTDGIRVPQLALLGGLVDFSGSGSYLRFISSYYYYVLVLFLVSVMVMWVIVQSPFGKTLQAIRDNETRARFLGIRIRRYRWFAFLISGTFTGLAGALWVPLNGLTTPDVLWWPFSGEIVFMTVLGGFRSFAGPIVGAMVFNFLKAYAVASTEFWQMLLGVVLIALVLALPGGIVGMLAKLSSRFAARRREEALT